MWNNYFAAWLFRHSRNGLPFFLTALCWELTLRWSSMIILNPLGHCFPGQSLIILQQRQICFSGARYISFGLNIFHLVIIKCILLECGHYTRGFISFNNFNLSFPPIIQNYQTLMSPIHLHLPIWNSRVWFLSEPAFNLPNVCPDNSLCHFLNYSVIFYYIKCLWESKFTIIMQVAEKDILRFGSCTENSFLHRNKFWEFFSSLQWKIPSSSHI